MPGALRTKIRNDMKKARLAVLTFSRSLLNQPLTPSHQRTQLNHTHHAFFFGHFLLLHPLWKERAVYRCSWVSIAFPSSELSIVEVVLGVLAAK
jgi:hypothetical protein